MQSINQHLLESITTSQKKNSVFHEGFDSISGFLSASKSYGLLTPCTNFCVSLYHVKNLFKHAGESGHFQVTIPKYLLKYVDYVTDSRSSFVAVLIDD